MCEISFWQLPYFHTTRLVASRAPQSSLNESEPSYDPTAILIFWTVLEKEKVVLRGAKGPAADGRGCSSGVSAMMSARKKEERER